MPMTYVVVFLLDMFASVCHNVPVKKKVRTKLRVRVKWNTGQRIHTPKKGKGSYVREKGKKNN